MFGYTIISKTELEKLKKEASGTNFLEYTKGYMEGRKYGEQMAIEKKYTPNEIRRIFGLEPIEEEEQNA